MDSRKKLEQIVESAMRSGRYCKQTYIQSFRNVCVYGMGKLFEDTFEDRDLAKRFHVNYLSDADPAKKLRGGIAASPL